MSLILLLFAPVALQYERGHQWLFPFALVFFVLDVIANYTELALLTWDFPRAHEYTFSKRLTRLKSLPGIRGDACWLVSDYLNYISPGHVK